MRLPILVAALTIALCSGALAGLARIIPLQPGDTVVIENEVTILNTEGCTFAQVPPNGFAFGVLEGARMFFRGVNLYCNNGRLGIVAGGTQIEIKRP